MYRHHWAYQPSHSDYAHAWPTILADSRRIIERVRHAGIVIAGPDGYRRPLLDATDAVSFNGDASTDLAGDTFTLLAPLPNHPQGMPVATASCATNRKPYDLAVSTVLLRCVLLLPQVFLLASDGAWDREWAYGATPGTTAPPLGARAVIASLFDLRPPDDPLRATVAGVRFTTGSPGT